MGGIQIKYSELLRLSIEHLFYQNKVCRQFKTEPRLDISIVPTADCLNVMKKLDIVFRTTNANGGFILLARVLGKNSGGDDLLRFPARKEDGFSFLMILNNADVINFDDLPTQPPAGNIYYFSNEITDAAAPRNSLHIMKDATGVNGPNDSIKKSSENYRFHHTAEVPTGTAKVKHILTGQATDPKSLVNQGGQCDLTFDLSSLPPGKCQLLINNVVTDQFFYLGKIASQHVFGVIELWLTHDLAANYRVVEPDRSLTPARPMYLIRFINRQTFWRYTIQLQTNSPLFLEIQDLSPADKIVFLNQLNIVSNDTSITFSKITTTDREFVFVSDNILALQEKYFSSTSLTHDVLIITLKKYIGDVVKEAAVKTYLPYPSTSAIDASALPQIYSDIFLTV